MSVVQLSIENTPKHGRLSVFFRPVLAIPHVIVGGLWGIVVGIVSLVQWVRIIITGSRSQGIWNMQNSWLSYATRVKCYQSYLFDAFPAFGATPRNEPVSYSFDFDRDAGRLSTLFRVLLAIPAYILLLFLSIGAGFVGIIAWFALMIAGRFPDGMFGFVLKSRRLSARLTAYSLYMTDSYPKSN